MSIPLVEKAIDKIPSYVLVYSLVSGLMLVFISPLGLHLPQWIINPFSQDFPSILGSFLTIAIVSLCLGFPMYLAHPLLLGDDGLNSRIMKLLGLEEDEDKGEEEESVKLDLENQVKFLKWLWKKEYSFFADFLMIQYGLLCALIIGSEVALIPNIIYVLATPLTSPSYLTYFYTAVICFFIFLASIAYNRWHFRRYFNTAWNALKKIYKDDISSKRV